MNRPLLNKLTQAILYEGYVLYPYRPSVKNTQRWTFGGLFPEAWSAACDNTDPCLMQTQCLIHGPPTASLEISLRFLHLIHRTHIAPGLPGVTPPPWQESLEREINLPPLTLASLLTGAQENPFSFPHQHKTEPLQPDDLSSPLVTREQQPIAGHIEITAQTIADNLHQLTVKIRNTTPLARSTSARSTNARSTGFSLPDEEQAKACTPCPSVPCSRDDALLRSFASTHILLGITGADFLSLTDPPEPFAAHAAACKNIGVWPILVGQAPAKDTLLASPIILPDYPELAPESPGDLFDSSEIDEILTLRILTLTDEEKTLAAATDHRVKSLLARTENLAREQLSNLHGALRTTPVTSPFPMPSSKFPDPWTPFDPDLENQTRIQQITTPAGHLLKIGDQVRLRPTRQADIMDLALAGKIATILLIEQDYENHIHLAVTIDDDPGNDLGRAGKIAHRFYFALDEIEPLAPAPTSPDTEYRL